MAQYICSTCGTQFAESAAPPPRCPICEDERQFVGWQGQAWTTLEELRTRHRVSLQREAPGLEGIGIEPRFAIGQRALLVRTGGGNVLWDCIPLVDEPVVEAIRALGGLKAIAVSHPHYYGGVIEWSRALGGEGGAEVPVYLHAADQRWIMRPDPSIRLWDGETMSLGPGLTLVRCGGHFEGATVLHWAGGAEGRGCLLAGDVVQVAEDRRHVSFMYSYPNYIPLGPRAVRRIVGALEPFRYDQIFGAWWGRNILAGGEQVVARSAARYLAHVGED
ncbi:MAG TPA: hypothetical protein VM716_04750 [Gemmatimonadales bacterium]|nr:hypothetical protein [Gemmatimonadales bacterium]